MRKLFAGPVIGSAVKVDVCFGRPSSFVSRDKIQRGNVVRSRSQLYGLRKNLVARVTLAVRGHYRLLHALVVLQPCRYPGLVMSTNDAC